MSDIGSSEAPGALSSRAVATLSRGLRDDQRSFAAVLGRTGVGPLGSGPSLRKASSRAGSAPEKAREAAEQLVAIGLVQPVLKELRESNRASPPFAPSQGERQFRALLDAELAQRIVRAARFPLVERLARELLTGSGGGSAPSRLNGVHHGGSDTP
jgi:hypothetical protein